MRAHGHENDQIACRPAVPALTALPAQGDTLPVVNAGGNRDGQTAVLTLQSGAPALGAGRLDVAPGAAAFLTGGLGLEGHPAHPLNHNALTGAAAVRAGLGGGSGFRAGTVARGTFMQARVVDFLFAAGDCLLKAQHQAHLHVLPTLGTRAPRRTAAAECTAENAAEYVAQIAEIGKAAVPAAGARRWVEGCLAELVILCLLVRVGQHGVCLVDLLEVLLGIRIAGVQVGVILLGELAVGALDRLRIGAPVYAEYLIIISVFCHIFVP